MQTVYSASTGEYSDYAVYKLFTTEELAKEYVAQKRGHFVEEFQLWDTVPEQVPYRTMRFDYWRDGIRENDNTDFYDADGSLDECHVTTYGNEHLCLIVRGTDIEKVAKVYSEYRAKMIAQIEGIA